VFNDYTFTVLKSIELPFDAKVDGFNVRVVQRKVCKAKRHRVASKIVKYLPSKYDGSIEPAIKPYSDEYYILLYLCLKASKGVPKGLKVDKRWFGRTLTEWLKELPENVLELS
jgi:hypothetical protein